MPSRAISYVLVIIYIIVSVCVYMFPSDNSKTLYVANNPGRGYVNKLFEPNLRYFYDFLMDGDFIFASQVCIIITPMCTYSYNKV